MKIHEIALDEEGLPETVKATMTLAELAVIARWTGGLSPNTSPDYDATSGIYDALVGDVVNRFWDDGLNDVPRASP